MSDVATMARPSRIDMSLLDDLVAVAAGTREPDDEHRRHASARAFVDWLGCALGGAAHPIREVMEQYVTPGQVGPQAPGAASLVASPSRAHPALAAMYNGTVSHVLDFDDVNPAMTGHPGVVVFSTLLALAESTGATLDQVIDAAPYGYSAAELLGLRVNPEHYEQGWHATGTLGAIAAAVAGSRLLELPADAARTAIAASASRTALRAAFGSHGKALNVGRAAEAAVEACLLSAAGLELPGEVLTGSSGYLALLGAAGPRSSTARSAPMDDTPLLPRAIHRSGFKLHAACGGTHSTIEAVARLAREQSITPEQVERIEVTVHPTAVQAASKVDPMTPLDAKFSLQHLAALAMFRYPIQVDAFEHGVFDAAPVLALREHVTVTVDESFVYDQAMPASVRILTKDGGQFDIHVGKPKGRPADPLTDQELVDKALALATSALPGHARDELSRLLWLVLRAEPCALDDLVATVTTGR